MNRIAGIAAALALGLFAQLARAQEPPAPPPAGEPGRPHPPRDCSKLPDEEKKARCEAMQAAFKAAQEKCKDVAKHDEHRKCMMEAMPKRKER